MIARYFTSFVKPRAIRGRVRQLKAELAQLEKLLAVVSASQNGHTSVGSTAAVTAPKRRRMVRRQGTRPAGSASRRPAPLIDAVARHLPPVGVPFNADAVVRRMSADGWTFDRKIKSTPRAIVAATLTVLLRRGAIAREGRGIYTAVKPE